MLNGHLDTVSRQRISGWAWDSDEPDTPISVIVTADDEVIARVLANRFRPDLKAAGFGNGRFGFEIWPGPQLLPGNRYVVSARRETDGAYLPGSLARLEAATVFDAAMQESFAIVMNAVDSDEDLERRLGFLASQTEALLQIHADRRSGVHEREARRRRRWQEAGGLTDGSRSEDPAPRPRALVIDDKIPRPAHDAGSNAILSHMHALQRIGFAVNFVPADLDTRTGDLEGAGIACCTRPWVSSVEDVLARQPDSFQLVYIHRAPMAARYAALVRAYQPKCRLVYSVADLHFLRLARQAKVEQRPELDAQSRYYRTIELMAAWQADAVITHSRFEAGLLAQRIHAAKLHVVPWAVPLAPTGIPFAARRGLAFVGGYAHQPNVDAARWLVGAIMPAIEAHDPTLPCLLVGSDMPDSLRQTARGNVEATGQVDTLAAVFDRVRLTVAPLAFGAGIKGKVLDSLAAGIPCICTPAAAEGLDLPPLLLKQVSSDPADLAAKILRMHDDEALNAACGTAGLAYMEATTSEARIDALLRKVAGPAVNATG